MIPQNPAMNESSWDRKEYLERIYKQTFDGIFHGIVEDNLDPKRLRRLRIRVPSIHRTFTTWPTEWLPWATRCNTGGGGFDYGDAVVIPVGASVWVMFEGGNARFPVVMGAFHKAPQKTQVYNQFRETSLPVPPEKRSDGPWKGKEATIKRTSTDDPEQQDDLVRGQHEAPAETRREAFHVPTVSVPFKSWKGATFAADDRDAREWMEITDRSGQGLRFDSRITKEKNKYNAAQRGLRSVFRGTQYNYKNDTDNRESSVSLRDLAQQGIHTEARKHDERVKVASRDAAFGDKSAIDFDLGGNVHTVELAAGQKKTVIEGRNAGRVMFKLTFDSQKGSVNIETVGDIRLSGQNITLVSESLNILGDTTINGDLHVTGSESVVGEVVHATIVKDHSIT